MRRLVIVAIVMAGSLLGVTVSTQQPPPQQPQQAAGDAPMTRERIQQTIDNLDEQLAAGKISEENYNRLSAKWQKKLEELG